MTCVVIGKVGCRLPCYEYLKGHREIRRLTVSQTWRDTCTHPGRTRPEILSNQTRSRYFLKCKRCISSFYSTTYTPGGKQYEKLAQVVREKMGRRSWQNGFELLQELLSDFASFHITYDDMLFYSIYKSVTDNTISTRLSHSQEL